MKGNIYYVASFAMALLVFLTTGPAISATTTTTTTTTDLTQSGGTTNHTNQTQTTQEGTVRVDVGKGSNITVQYYTFSPSQLK